MINYIDNNASKTILLLHGLGCNDSYFDTMVELFQNQYNLVIPTLSGHYKESNDNFSLDDELNNITIFCEKHNIILDIIIAHSMSSILALMTDRELSTIEKIYLLEGNIIEDDFEWSNQMSQMNEEDFEKYWSGFQRKYPLILKMKLKTKHDLKIYSEAINNIAPKGLHCYSRLIASFQDKMDIFQNSYPKIVYFESKESKLLPQKIEFFETNNIVFETVGNTSHYIMLDNPEYIIEYLLKETV